MQISAERLTRELQSLAQANWLALSTEAMAALDNASQNPADRVVVLMGLLQQPMAPQGWLVSSPMVSEAWLQPQLPSALKDGCNPLLAYLVAEANTPTPLSPHPLLAPDHFLQQLAAAGAQPAADLSLLAVLAALPPQLCQRVSPHPLFDPAWYLDHYRDLPTAAQAQPFQHFLSQGKQERRDPSPRFNTRVWLLRRGGDANTAANPLADFLLTRLQNPTLPLPEAGIHGDVFGIDKDGRLIGWAWDPRSDDPVNLEIWCGEQRVGHGQANQHREELAASGIIHGQAGFAISVRLDRIAQAIADGIPATLKVVATPADRDPTRQGVLQWDLPDALIPNLPALIEQTLTQTAHDLIASGNTSEALVHIDASLQRLPESKELQQLRRSLCSSLYLQSGKKSEISGIDFSQDLQAVEQELTAFEALLTELESALTSA